MLATLALFLLVLILAGGVLIWEARTGRFTSASRRHEGWRGLLFFLATVVGGALLIRAAGGSLLFAVAFVPVTVLSLMRFVTLARRRWVGAASALALALALVAGTAAGLTVLPEPIDQGVFLERIFHPERGTMPESIDPAARRAVRA